MTNQEAIKLLEDIKSRVECFDVYIDKEEGGAINLAIHALEIIDSCPVFSDDEVKQPCIESPCSHERPHGENVYTYTEDDMCAATCDGYDIAKNLYEFDAEDFKKFVESRVDMQDLYLPIHFFDLLDEYCGTDKRGGRQ